MTSCVIHGSQSGTFPKFLWYNLARYHSNIAPYSIYNSNKQQLWQGRPFSYPWSASRGYLSDLKLSWLGSVSQWHSFFIFSKQNRTKKTLHLVNYREMRVFCIFIEKIVQKKMEFCWLQSHEILFLKWQLIRNILWVVITEKYFCI